MKPLVGCLKKFGKAINADDASFIKSLRKEYIESGLSGQEATNKALNDWIETLDNNLSELKEEITEAGGHVPATSYSTTPPNVPRETSRSKQKWLKAEREDGKPFYLGDGFFLKPVAKLRTRDDFSTHPRALDWGHTIQVKDGIEAWAIDIIGKNGAEYGTMAVQIDPKTDQIVAIHDIHITERGAGLGSKIVKQVVANADKPVKIIQMLDTALGFWQKMGVDYRDPNTHSGELSWKQHTRPQETKTADKGDLKKSAENETIQENVEEYQLDEKQEKGIEDDWLYRIEHNDAPDLFSVPDDKLLLGKKYLNVDKTIRYVQNKFLPLKKVQEAILESGKVITDEMNAEVKEELMHKRAANDQEKVQNTYIKKIVDFLHANNLTMEELGLFVYVKHAPERNDFIARRRNAHLDNKKEYERLIAEIKKDIAEAKLKNRGTKLKEGQLKTVEKLLSEWKGNNEKWGDGGSGMTNKQSVDNLRGFANEGKINELEEAANIVYAMLKNKSDRLNEFGLLSDAQQKAWGDYFKFYVPLKDFQDDGGDTETDYIGKTGKGFNIQGKESMHALGRRSMAANPVATAITDSMAAIMRARKNEVGQAFLKLVEDNPNKEYWTIHTENNPGTREILNKKTGKVENVPLSFVDMGSLKDKYMGVKVDGEQIYIQISDERLIKAMNSMGDDATNGIIQTMAGLTRILSSLNTSMNLEFIISNGFRDPQTAVMNALAETEIKGGKLFGKFKSSKDKAAFAARIGNPKNIMSAIGSINSAIKNPDTKGEMQDHWREFREMGAETGYFDQKTFTETTREINNMFKIAQGGFEGNVRKYSKKLFDVIERMNTSVENGVRLTAYIEAKAAGLTKQQAASFAKNLTVNFNRKGEITWLNAIYMFGNASVQGTAQFLRSVASNPMKHPSGKTKLTLAQKAAVTMSVAGYMFAMMNRELGGEDDDGEKWVDKIKDHVLERNIVILKSVFGGKEDGTYWTIPLPYGYNIFHNAGTALESVNNGSKRKNIAWASRFVTFSMLGSFSPIGMSTSKQGLETAAFKTVTPTLFKPFAEMAVDENFFGGHIFRNKTFDRSKTIRDSLGKESTGAHWKFVSDFLSNFTGGSKLEGGFIDIAPESFKHVFTTYVGGLGRLVDNTTSLVGDLAQGKDIETRKIPFVRKVSGGVSKYSSTSDFYDRKDDIYRDHDELKLLKGRDKIIFRREKKESIALYSLARATEKRLRALRKQRKAIEAQNNPNKKVRMDRVQEKMDQAVTRFNKKYNELFN